ncbi:hypothetical protein POM88_032239 [Heracleum sosnowskyi]|uniref:RNase H type-1 domain-containing protein n=1 Tax=Heracleum sosnowskyi TaxID=360622 RepID=A0AAD8I068_9APIA|nr:hypothetical protein POM88_032239 [Heracleum sosnowskyi]
MKAMETGLDLAKRMGIRHLMIQMDSLSCIYSLQSSEPYGKECVHIVHQCRDLIKNNNWEVTFFHCYREGNRAADWLANQGVVQDTRVQMIQVPPLELSCILHEDLDGVSWPLVSS